ncbi:hypothetical protein LWC34_52915 [Kibdelosporangium philippinense]|uniref:DUF6801 domain-containing protein n=1 Tax=Kibdelosporangium philippinense TaxID=211113 RepID=A0ABS8ZUP5_9PSEU|nr:DUF6801 domain-containing protein [Kibdelosporangium philippinense]MCE7011460.1 hypothetical protein [Kibdelosporangium philippinense]
MKSRFSGRRSAAIVAVAALAAGGFVASAQAAVSMGEVTKNLTYRCAFPLVGQQDVNATVNITIPDTGTTGTRIVNGDLKITATLSANIVNALRAFQTATTEGTAVADVDAAYDSKNMTLGIPGLKIAKQTVPPSGTMPVDISGPVPSLIVYKTGSVSLAAGAVFTAKVDTRKADGTPTALGVLNVPCTVKATTPPQDRSLASIAVSGDEITPPAPGTPPSQPIDKSLTYSCVFPETGAVNVAGRITGTIPATGTVNNRVQPSLSVTATLPISVVDVLRNNSAATVSGKGVADADNAYNGTSITVGIPGPVPSVNVPASGELTATLSPAVPSVAVGAAGVLTISAGQQLNGTFTPLKADGTPTALGTFDVPCTLAAGQDPTLGAITFS